MLVSIDILFETNEKQSEIGQHAMVEELWVHYNGVTKHRGNHSDSFAQHHKPYNKIWYYALLRKAPKTNINQIC